MNGYPSWLFLPMLGFSMSHPILPWAHLMQPWEWILLTMCLPGARAEMLRVLAIFKGESGSEKSC